MRIQLYLLLSLLLVAGCATKGDSNSTSPARFNIWFDDLFLTDTPVVASPPGLLVQRFDHGTLQLGQSVLKTPLQIGTQRYTHGLGTHAVSEIVVTLSSAATQFTAQVGVDNNNDTKGQPRRRALCFRLA